MKIKNVAVLASLMLLTGSLKSTSFADPMPTPTPVPNTSPSGTTTTSQTTSPTMTLMTFTKDITGKSSGQTGFARGGITESAKVVANAKNSAQLYAENAAYWDAVANAQRWAAADGATLVAGGGKLVSKNTPPATILTQGITKMVEYEATAAASASCVYTFTFTKMVPGATGTPLPYLPYGPNPQ